jgi:hypothetical protein
VAPCAPRRALACVVRVRARRAGHRTPRQLCTRRARAAEPARRLRADLAAAAAAHDARVAALAADLDAMAIARAVESVSGPHDLSALFDKPAAAPVLAPARDCRRAHRPRRLTLPAPDAPAPGDNAVFFAHSPTDADDADGVGKRAPSVSVERWVRIARAGVACSTHSSCLLLTAKDKWVCIVLSGMFMYCTLLWATIEVEHMGRMGGWDCGTPIGRWR